MLRSTFGVGEGATTKCDEKSIRVSKSRYFHTAILNLMSLWRNFHPWLRYLAHNDNNLSLPRIKIIPFNFMFSPWQNSWHSIQTNRKIIQIFNQKSQYMIRLPDTRGNAHLHTRMEILTHVNYCANYSICRISYSTFQENPDKHHDRENDK